MGKKSWLFVLLAFFLYSIFFYKPFFYQGQGEKTEISEGVFPALEKQEFIPVIVVLKDRANLSDALFSKEKESTPVKAIINKLQETARASQKEIQPVLKEEIEKGNIKGYNPFWIVNAFAAQINTEALARLSALPQVAHIRQEQQYSLSTTLKHIPTESGEEYPPNQATYQGETGERPWNLDLIKAPLVWQQGIYGREVVVAIMDTGVDLHHPALKERYRGNLPGHGHDTSWYDAAADGSTSTGEPRDTNGHGTHIAGIIMGGSPDEPLGVAPGARWIAVNIFKNGYAWDSHIIQAFQWLMAPGGDPRNAPRIINCSWASRPEYVRDYLQWEILHNLESAGILVIFAAGNNGASGPGSPASYPHAFSVGAVKKEGDRVQIADFSSKGPVNWQEITYTKPEICAPGVNIRSSWLKNGFTVLDGTSLAAAHVSGAAALLLEAQPELSPLEVKYILQQGAYWEPAWNELGKRPNNVYGFGVLDVQEAYKNIAALSPRETLLEDGAEEGIINWRTSPESPWKITREKVSEGRFSFADSPWEQYKNNSQSWLALAKPLSFNGYHSPVISFDHFYDLATGNDKEDDYAYVEISTDGKNWAYLYRFSGTNGQFNHFSIPLPLPAGTDKAYVRFRLESNKNGPGGGWYLDNISISAIPLPLTELDRLTLSPARTIIGVEDSTEITASALFGPNLSKEISPELLEWSSSDLSIAAVEKGIVRGISPGEAVISGQFAGYTAELKIKVLEAKAPTIQPAPGTYTNAVTFTLMPATPGAKVFYTLDGSEPDENSLLYENPVTITEDTMIKAREYWEGIPGPSKQFSYMIKEGTYVSGSIALQGRSLIDSQTNISLINVEGNQSYIISDLSTEGKFLIELPLGSYKLVAKRKQYLTKTLKIELNTKDERQEVAIELRAGDLNNDNRIDITDLTILSLAYRSKPGVEHWNPLADLNSDGVIDSFDLTVLTQNLGLQGDR
jgi:hypothetical protein